MARIVVWLIGRLGRYAVILVLLPIALIGYGWLGLFDHHPYVALAAALVVGPLSVAGVTLALGMLLVPGAPPLKDTLSREEAPRLWALWDEIDPKPSKRRAVVVTDQLNASMGELRGSLGLRRTEILAVGLPLLMACDEAAIWAILAHEVGHARLAHASGLTNVNDFVGSFDMLFLYADPHDTVLGGLADLALSGGMRRLKREMRAVSRRHEFEADAFAGAQTSDAARALVIVEATAHSMDALVHRPLEQELLGAVSPPPPPIARTAAHLAEIHRRGVTATARLEKPRASGDLLADEALYGSTHPTFEERLKSLGYDAPPEIAPVATPASAALLPPETLARLTKTFDDRWTREARWFIDGNG
ncbi:M48 family metallopeptidase [Methylopila turkensis]|uniref:Peptidase M48 domain-containing protein n=1 Tax=Methylopila turkensis TaxID=1437816 RepID=A0A9W6N8T5_9HYPH|nr:M48 family metallopeptidase [Methylopila turkensis]GLK81701.1 hypothetical protein GCM10008174_34420 [Methylopila turkensis]